MGEIKFRALDNKLKRLFSDVRSIGFENGEICCFIGESDNEEDTKSEYIYLNNAILQQYTELKDKNGKEIYEGDIVKFRNGRKDVIAKVWYFAPTWMLADYTSGKLNGSFEMADFGRGREIDELEVIGNIYQNPELLERKK